MRRSLVTLGAVTAALVVTSCAPAAIAGGVFAAGIVSAIVFSSCDEPASVQVWDNTSAYPVCNAEVVAVSETGAIVKFSPCYSAQLGDGVWHVTATKPGFPPAKGVITVAEDRRCSEPTFHSLDLTLGSDATRITEPRPAPPPPPPASPAPPLPPPSATSSPTPSSTPSSSSTPSPSPSSAPSPSSSVPAAAFPSQSPPPEVPAPPTR